ncbi:hypothetical protein TRSC58_07532 [Trypanosoma rangeli SC58]|uniref:Uncharacterized protein n=1 Tax=Trypanosoma rangeli SC58 TaxID=429131 RepID=A0A061ISY7_TRYRA|nr:hypothetical protein TRSC58_07532 [Trypanosoma rangeli SC58]
MGHDAQTPNFFLTYHKKILSLFVCLIFFSTFCFLPSSWCCCCCCFSFLNFVVVPPFVISFSLACFVPLLHRSLLGVC